MSSDALSKREIEVLHWLANGASLDHIAEEMKVSLKTIKTHLRSARQKLDARDDAQAVAKALRTGLIR